jgi:hypothetical protein
MTVESHVRPRNSWEGEWFEVAHFVGGEHGDFLMVVVEDGVADKVSSVGSSGDGVFCFAGEHHRFGWVESHEVCAVAVLHFDPVGVAVQVGVYEHAGEEVAGCAGAPRLFEEGEFLVAEQSAGSTVLEGLP